MTGACYDILELECLVGGFDQFHFLPGCTPQETRAAVHDAVKLPETTEGTFCAHPIIFLMPTRY